MTEQGDECEGRCLRRCEVDPGAGQDLMGRRAEDGGARCGHEMGRTDRSCSSTDGRDRPQDSSRFQTCHRDTEEQGPTPEGSPGF